ncbi:hypothetical protein [Thermodesulfovibrio sp.]|uniref:hypothetical protein n=1 Tax=Thermodesulfovibrio sp. TaxID=2067987 RepID=UPI0030A6291B
MGIFSVEVFEEIEKLEPNLRKAFIGILKTIERNLGETVKREDFQELKAIVEKLGERIDRLAEAQEKTEQRLNELAEAQKRTEQRVNELAEAQKRTEQRLNELAEAQKKTEEEVRKLAIGLGNLRGEVGGISRTFSYAFENESYRKLPEYLKNQYGIEITEKFVRTEVGGEEINFFAKGRKNGKEIYIVGEAKLRLDEGRKDFEKAFKELERKDRAVKSEYGDVETVKMIVTHFAKKNALKLAKERNIIVVQSFEW